MGYETKIIVGIEYDLFGESDQKRYGATIISPVATVDLSKAGWTTATAKVLAQARAASEHFYGFYATPADDMSKFDPEGESCGVVTSDLYGERLTAVPLSLLLAAMRKDNEDDPYRRFALAIAMLSCFQAPEWNETIRVIQYGY